MACLAFALKPHLSFIMPDGGFRMYELPIMVTQRSLRTYRMRLAVHRESMTRRERFIYICFLQSVMQRYDARD